MTQPNLSEYNKLLIISPHPYDCDLWAGGTIRSFIESGKTIHAVICTDGSKTTNKPDVEVSHLKELRCSEQKESAKILGIHSMTFLELIDGELEDIDEFRKLIVRQIRKEQPDLVITSEPYRKFLPWHRDNRITGQVTLDSVYPYGRDHLHYQELWEKESLEPHNTRAIWFWGTENPNIFIDIGNSVDTKITALQCHKTQIYGQDNQDFASQIKDRASDASSGLISSESFREVTFRV